MKPSKKLAAGLARAVGVSGVAIMAGVSPAQAAPNTTQMETFNAEPVNNIGIALYNANINDQDADGLDTIAPGDDDITLDATQVGSDANLEITVEVGPKAGAAAVAAGTYEYEFDIVEGTTIVLSGDQCQTGALGTAVALGGNYPGANLDCTIVAPTAGLHTYDIRNMNIQGNGAGSGGTLAAPRTGFDANANRSANPSQSNAGANFVPDATADFLIPSSTYISLADYSITAVSTQSVTTHARVGNTVTVAGTQYGAAAAPGVPTVTVNGIAGDNNTLTVDGSGNLSGTFDIPSGVGTGAKNVVIANGVADTRTKSITILDTAAATPTSATVGLGGSVAVTLTTNTWNPNQLVTATGAGSASTTANASGGGSFSVPISVNAPTVTLTQGSNSFVINITVLADKCIAEDGANSFLPGQCSIEQTVNVSIEAGILAQRHYNNPTPTTGSNNGATPNVNAGNQTVNLGTIRVPSGDKYINGIMNDITVTDTRGGLTGWSLTATMGNFASGVNSINASALKVSPTCTTATTANAWDYDASAKTAITGYIDPWASAISGTTVLATVVPDLTTAGALTAFTNSNGTPAVNLCTKGTNLNNYGTTGGVFNVTGPLELKVPPFQAVGTYQAIMTVTLA
jgi:hypothetical protein